MVRQGTDFKSISMFIRHSLREQLGQKDYKTREQKERFQGVTIWDHVDENNLDLARKAI